MSPRTLLPLALLLAACGGHASRSAAAPDAALAPAPAPQTCATAECFVAAVDAHHDATYRVEAVTDEGGHIYTTFRATAGAIEMTIDDRDDAFAASRGIHVQRCTSVKMDGARLDAAGCT